MLEKYKEILKPMLSEKRYIHSIGVSKTARELAQRYNTDADKAELAGLIHDCAKDIPKDKIQEYCRRYNYIPDAVEQKNIGLIHAPLGAKMIDDIFGITDREIKKAVKYHTTAGENMSPLDKIIYLADMIEPSRNYKEANELRRLSLENLDNAFLKALDYSLIFNIQKGVLIHPNTLLARNELIMKG